MTAFLESVFYRISPYLSAISDKLLAFRCKIASYSYDVNSTVTLEMPFQCSFDDLFPQPSEVGAPLINGLTAPRLGEVDQPSCGLTAPEQSNKRDWSVCYSDVLISAQPSEVNALDNGELSVCYSNGLMLADSTNLERVNSAELLTTEYQAVTLTGVNAEVYLFFRYYDSQSSDLFRELCIYWGYECKEYYTLICKTGEIVTLFTGDDELYCTKFKLEI